MENNETYRLCLRKLSGEDLESDGLVDFVDNRITLNKIAYYKRFVFDDNSLLSLFSRNVYESRSMNNSLVMELDDGFIYVARLNISNNLKRRNISVTRFGYHEIVETDNTRFENVLMDYYPNVINQYAANFSDLVV